MAYIKDKITGLRTVGEVIAALKKFPKTMPIGCGLDDAVKVYREEPEAGELYEDSRGQITIDGDDE